MSTNGNLSGVLIMNKPEDFTSHDVVAKLRGILKTRKIGHGGTLDPMATGVLPVFIGGATKAADFAAAQCKEYVAGFKLGICTDTQDTTGEVLGTSDKKVTREQVLEVINASKGEQLQLPPMYSAIKVDGKKLYDLARKGIEVERKKRAINIFEFELLEFDETAQTGLIRILSSKGTYIRTICNDLGEKLGTFGAMTSLIRTKSGSYGIDKSYGFDEVKEHMDNGTINQILMPTDSMFMDHPAVTLDDYGANRAQNGAFISSDHAKDMPEEEGALSRVYHNGEFLMLGVTKTLDKGGKAIFTYKKFL